MIILVMQSGLSLPACSCGQYSFIIPAIAQHNDACKKTFLALELSKSPLKRFVHLSVNPKDEDAHFAICVGHSLVYECYLKLPVGLWKRAASSNIKKKCIKTERLTFFRLLVQFLPDQILQ